MSAVSNSGSSPSHKLPGRYPDTKRQDMGGDVDDTTQISKLEFPLALTPTVLIVDDDALVLARLQEIVEAEGYRVRTAPGGAEALNSLEESPASIVITDLNMPGMDGLDLCRRIREHTWPGYVYIVLLSVRDGEKQIVAGLDAGADDFLSKRTSGAQFTARLRTANRILALESSLKSAVEKKRQLAMTDALTGVYNRRYFMRHLSRELKRAQRFGGDVSLLLLDIDHFKQINDTYGHVVGDVVLSRLTRQITKCLKRETDWCARLGGDEFAVVLEGTKVAEARACAEKVRQAIANTAIDTAAGSVRITVSIGVTGLEGIVNRDLASVQPLLEHADKNLYASKAGGRNRVTLSTANGADPGTGGPVNQWPSHAKPKVSLSSVR
jgi:two-component system, cell cycle response regulator